VVPIKRNTFSFFDHDYHILKSLDFEKKGASIPAFYAIKKGVSPITGSNANEGNEER